LKIGTSEDKTPYPSETTNSISGCQFTPAVRPVNYALRLVSVWASISLGWNPAEMTAAATDPADERTAARRRGPYSLDQRRL
jgi:hypothetical protein